MSILETYQQDSWNYSWQPEETTLATNTIENGKILFLPNLKFTLEENEKKFLAPACLKKGAKNISYNLHTDKLNGAEVTAEDYLTLKNMLQRYAQQSATLIANLFPHYQNNVIHARTSYRPVQVSQRKTSYRKDDKLLHIDAFPATPNQGMRLLRVFCNIHPGTEPRLWHIGQSFPEVAQQFLPHIKKPIPGFANLLKYLKLTKTLRSEYDHIMLHMHNKMKADSAYQAKAKMFEVAFPAGSSWIVQTDQVSHAALSGQYMLEQTFYLPVTGMLQPELSPLKVLEKMLQRQLAP